MAPNLHITDKEGFSKGMIKARVGLITSAGVITRVSNASIWTQSKNGSERLHRSYDGRLPSIPLYKVSKADRRTLGI